MEEEVKNCPKCRMLQKHTDSKCQVCGHTVMDSILALYPSRTPGKRLVKKK
ncbi:hypothetical protein M4D55_09425 [Metabacillus idriensis]|uniref:Uncharacterized protein n=1 Tax=Metabacillus idriensis TaxID=324768 RepID=A0A6I2MFU1_9BACI|nr:hypothetical protein [Metabacillus idriensis]MCM3596001.1 hypothetical protein [Metabacillus idriensis]MDR0137784.1 hypothetical protein [Metabacillus idriensis]MRX56679.1 hypothetical protein [Metabacillus idriensis]